MIETTLLSLTQRAERDARPVRDALVQWKGWPGQQKAVPASLRV